MNYIELSIANVEEKTRELYQQIVKKYDYEVVIFIARGSYIIGKTLADLKNVPLLEIRATRKGGKLKKLIKPFLKLIPSKILIKLREKEMKSTYHEKKNDREVSFNQEVYEKYKKAKRILLVDDSIDSGNSIIETKKVLEEYFKNAEIKVAVFNVMKKAVIKPDFYLYEDMMINGPWSNDSKENKIHMNLYQNWEKSKHKSSNEVKVSVAMATYNGEDFIREQIDSILANLKENDELIISDDGSIDKTKEILNYYSKNDKRVKVVVGPAKGVIKNFENALQYCTGDYIFLSDQDDVWMPKKRDKMVALLKDEDLMAAVHDAIVIDENNKEIMPSWFKHRNSKKGMIANIIKNRYLGCCMAFDSELLKYALPMPEDIEMHDWWLGLCAEKYGKTKFISQPLLKYRRHSKNVSSLKHYGLRKMIQNRLTLIYRLIRNKK